MHLRVDSPSRTTVVADKNLLPSSIPPKYDDLSYPLAECEGSGTVTPPWQEVVTFDLHGHGST